MSGSAPSDTSSADPATPERPTESVLIVPLAPVFAPAVDPSARHPDESADVEGYVVSPEQLVTVAVASGGPAAGDLLESVWGALDERGVAERRWSRTDDQGRTVAVLSVRLPDAAAAGELLRRTLVLPVRIRAGFAEIHLVAAPAETHSLERELQRLGVSPSSIAPGDPAESARNGGLRAEDWALLGLLQAVGVFDPRDAPHQSAVAEVLGVPPSFLDERVRAIEQGMHALVTTIFAPANGGEEAVA